MIVHDQTDRDTGMTLGEDEDAYNEDASASKTMHYFPPTPLELKPVVGMEFETDKAAYDFYNAYAKACGFSIRRERSWFKKDGIHYRQFMCSKQGYRKGSENDDGGKIKKRAITRCGCKAYIEFKVNHEIYKVNKFVEGHNHILHSPSKAHLLRSLKYMDDMTKARIKNLSISALRPAQCYNVMATELNATSQDSITGRYNELMVLANKCATDGAMYQRSYGRMKEILTNATIEIHNLNREEEMVEANQNEVVGSKEVVDNVHQLIASQCRSTNSITILDPKIVEAKGTGKRIGQACHSWQGIRHDSCNCPRNKKKRTLVDMESS